MPVKMVKELRALGLLSAATVFGRTTTRRIDRSLGRLR